MKKRLRKKRHLGEFRQYGFTVEAKLSGVISTPEFDAFVDSFIEDAIEANGLLFNGGGTLDSEWNGVIQREHRYESATEAHQTAVVEWLRARKEVASVRVSPLWDIWHGSDPFDDDQIGKRRRQPDPGATDNPDDSQRLRKRH